MTVYAQILTKLFPNEKYARDFQSGLLYANPLSFFQKQEKDQLGRFDTLEGSTWSGKDFVFQMRFDSTDWVNLTPHIIGPMRFNFINHIQIICFHLLRVPIPEYDHVHTITTNIPDRLQDEFGDYVAVIEEREFLNRLESQIKREYIAGNVQRCKMGVVQYADHQPIFTGNEDPLDAAFFKQETFRYQSEYRIAIEPSESHPDGCPFRVHIGDISDIVALGSSSSDLKFNIH